MATRSDYYWKTQKGTVTCTSTTNEEHKKKFEDMVRMYTGTTTQYDKKTVYTIERCPLDGDTDIETWGNA